MGEFTKFYLTITRARFEEFNAQGRYPDPDNCLFVVERDIKTDTGHEAHRAFFDLQRKTGGRYGWDRRPLYAPHNRKWIWRVLDHSDTRLFSLRVGLQENRSVEAGYCLVTSLALKGELFPVFRRAAEGDPNLNLNPENIVEIENFGLFRRHSGKGYGKFFLSSIFNILFENENTRVIGLSTRNTNQRGVVSFYKKRGMMVQYREKLPDDLLPKRGFYYADFIFRSLKADGYKELNAAFYREGFRRLQAGLFEEVMHKTFARKNLSNSPEADFEDLAHKERRVITRRMAGELRRDKDFRAACIYFRNRADEMAGLYCG